MEFGLPRMTWKSGKRLIDIVADKGETKEWGCGNETPVFLSCRKGGEATFKGKRSQVKKRRETRLGDANLRKSQDLLIVCGQVLLFLPGEMKPAQGKREGVHFSKKMGPPKRSLGSRGQVHSMSVIGGNKAQRGDKKIQGNAGVGL